MKKNIISLLIIIIAVALYLEFTDDKSVNEPTTETPTIATTTTQVSTLTEDDYMDIAIYVQNKDVAKKTDCRVTTKIEYTIPKTPAIADASLKILFDDELKKYGIYKSVSIVNGVADVILVSDMTPEGKPIGSLSSCESGHLMSVLKDTLVQYESIKSVKLFSPKGEIMF